VIRHLFVYGTLRDDPRHAMHHVLTHGGRYVGAGSVGGRLYDLGDYPGMVPSDRPGDVVTGEVYELAPDAAGDTLRVLDAYEGAGQEDPPSHRFLRQPVSVVLQDGTALQAWAYVLVTDPADHPLIPEGDYLASRRRARGGRADPDALASRSRHSRGGAP
jgi:gamma-glutamylcyclotransferase (GGCT)/AIG2-like uncharacterized protein YtfP